MTYCWRMELIKVLEKMRKVDGTRRFSMEDLYAFRTAVEKSLKKVTWSVLEVSSSRLTEIGTGSRSCARGTEEFLGCRAVRRITIATELVES